MSRVFIIDDDPIHQRIVQIIIEKHQIFDEYVSFTDARLALQDISTNTSSPDMLPDVILLDLNMPLMDGWEFLDAFRSVMNKLSKEIKIFIVSSSVDEKDISRSQTYPFVRRFITKPLSPDTIKGTI